MKKIHLYIFCLIPVFCLAQPFKKGTLANVLAPNGLNLRAEKSLYSEQITLIPYGSKVQIMEAEQDIPFEVDHIMGTMVQVKFDQYMGYCFSGYLTTFLLPKKGQSAKEYLAFLKEHFETARYQRQDNDPDFHQGYTDTYVLPTKKWHEAYYIAHVLHSLPSGLGFPNPMGPDTEEIEAPKKDENVWGSSLNVTRLSDKLEKLTYSFRTEGFGYSVTIQPTATGLLQVENLNFVD